jgi:hypothetical protein
LIGHPPEERSSYRGSSEDFLTGWGQPETEADVTDVMEKNYQEQDDDVELGNSESEATGFQTQTGKPSVAKPKGKRCEERGKFRAEVNIARQLHPAPLFSKRKAPLPPPSDEGNTGTKRSKPSEPSGLVPNWKKSAGFLEFTAHKDPVESIDSDDNAEGEFDKPESPEMLLAVRATMKPIDNHYKLVSNLLICDWTYLQLHAAWRQI